MILLPLQISHYKKTSQRHEMEILILTKLLIEDTNTRSTTHIPNYKVIDILVKNFDNSNNCINSFEVYTSKY